MSYEPTVSSSMPGQTLIPCGTPDSICSCSGEIELHVWEDDPELSQTLAHEATHASLYHQQRPFSHCSSRDRTTDCRNVDRLTSNAEREARLNSRDPDSSFQASCSVLFYQLNFTDYVAIYVSDNFR